MTKKLNKFHWINLILGLTTTLPIWLYLLYKILIAIEASELTWFLFIIYIPSCVLVAIISKVAEAKE